MKTEFMEIAQRNYAMTQNETPHYIPRHAGSKGMSKEEILVALGLLVACVAINAVCNIALATMRIKGISSLSSPWLTEAWALLAIS